MENGPWALLIEELNKHQLNPEVLQNRGWRIFNKWWFMLLEGLVLVS